jgi:hypothetical protein
LSSIRRVLRGATFGGKDDTDFFFERPAQFIAVAHAKKKLRPGFTQGGRLIMKIRGESLPLPISTQLDSFFKVRRTAFRRKNKLLSGSLFGNASFHPHSGFSQCAMA